MINYIITSGNSVVSEISDTTVQITNDIKKALCFDTIGEAMKNAAIVNSMIRSYSYCVTSRQY